MCINIHVSGQINCFLDKLIYQKNGDEVGERRGWRFSGIDI